MIRATIVIAFVHSSLVLVHRESRKMYGSDEARDTSVHLDSKKEIYMNIYRAIQHKTANIEGGLTKDNMVSQQAQNNKWLKREPGPHR